MVFFLSPTSNLSRCVFPHPEHQEQRTKASNVEILMDPAVLALCGRLSDCRGSKWVFVRTSLHGAAIKTRETRLTETLEKSSRSFVVLSLRSINRNTSVRDVGKKATLVES